MEDAEATQLVLETLFDVRRRCTRYTTPFSGAMMKRKKKTPEERAAELERRADLDRRLREMIEKYRQINARRRAATGE